MTKLQTLCEKLESIIEEEYKEEGWVVEIGFDKAPAMWSDIYYYIDRTYGEIEDDSLEDRLIHEFISKKMREFAERNLDALNEKRD